MIAYFITLETFVYEYLPPVLVFLASTMPVVPPSVSMK